MDKATRLSTLLPQGRGVWIPIDHGASDYPNPGLQNLETLVNQLFPAYMLYNEVPHWARHYARTILDMEAAGQLNQNSGAFHKYDTEFYRQPPKGLKKLLIAMVCIVVFLGGGLWMAELSAGRGVSILPPYFDDRNLNGKDRAK